MLIAFCGLPGTGKTTLARSLAHRLEATYLRTDTIEDLRGHLKKVQTKLRACNRAHAAAVAIRRQLIP